jgi:hypothetical protein
MDMEGPYFRLKAFTLSLRLHFRFRIRLQVRASNTDIPFSVALGHGCLDAMQAALYVREYNQVKSFYRDHNR